MFINIVIFTILIIITLHLFKIFKMYDQKLVTENYNLINKPNINVIQNIDKLHEPFNFSNVYEYGIFKTHIFKHSNDLDLNLSEIKDNMEIIDAGSGLLGPSLYFLKNYDIIIHSITNGSYKYQNDINNTINNLKLKDKIKPYFIDYHNIDKYFGENSIDRILFIESINYSNNIINLLKKSYKILNINGKIYIRMLIMPETSSEFLKNQYNEIQKKMNLYLDYHNNIIYYLQQANFKNIKFTSIPLVFSSNFMNPFFILSLKKLNLLNFFNLISFIPILSCTYIADK